MVAHGDEIVEGTPRQWFGLALWRAAKVISVVVGTWFLAVPQIPLAWEALAGLAGINVAVLLTGAALAVAAPLADAQLTRTLLEGGRRPGLWHMMGIITTSLGVSRAVPAGAAVGTFTAFRLLERAGVGRSRAAFAMTTRSVGSAVVLNALLWVALALALPRYGFATSYLLVIAAGAAVLLAGAIGADALLRRRSWLWASASHIARVLPKLEPGAVIRQLDDQSAQLGKLASRPAMVRKAFAWAVANWLIDAAALWVFLAAFGVTMSPVVVLAAFALANMAAAVPITPGGLGLVEVTLLVTLTSFGAPSAATVLGIAAFRVFNYWLPIPASILSYFAVRCIKTPPTRVALCVPLGAPNGHLSEVARGDITRIRNTNNGSFSTVPFSTKQAV